MITKEELRFWSKVQIQHNGCWEWTAGKNEKGYGCFYSPAHANHKAHRWAYEALVGPIPDHLQIDHLCRNRSCVNPAHLELVTAQENISRGLVGQYQSKKTHCKQGHPLKPCKEYTKKDGSISIHRFCPICQNRCAREWRIKHRIIPKATGHGSGHALSI